MDIFLQIRFKRSRHSLYVTWRLEVENHEAFSESSVRHFRNPSLSCPFTESSPCRRWRASSDRRCPGWPFRGGHIFAVAAGLTPPPPDPSQTRPTKQTPRETRREDLFAYYFHFVILPDGLCGPGRTPMLWQDLAQDMWMRRICKDLPGSITHRIGEWLLKRNKSTISNQHTERQW